MKKLYIFGIIFLVILGTVAALTVTSLGSGKYNVIFDSGRSVNVTNISYNKQTDVASMNINSPEGKGLTMKELAEVRAYVATLNGRANKMGQTTIHIN